MRHMNTKLVRYPFVIFTELEPGPPPPTDTYNRILPDGTFRIYLTSTAQQNNRIVKDPLP